MTSNSSSPVKRYRGRLAPSPTGYLHVGHARTFWVAYERARAANGTLVVRMDDLDPDRSRAIYAEAALEDLRWLGIQWEEGPDPRGVDKGGPFAPYMQSRRQATYLAVWRKLMRNGYLYPCRCSRKDIDAALNAPHEKTTGMQITREVDSLDDEPIYPGTCRPANCQTKIGSSTKSSAAAGDFEKPGTHNWRFRVPDGKVVEFDDLNLGPQRFVAGRDFGDFVVWRRDGIPSYQLACVADDAAMQITEVVRGADLLKSTARQILLYRALKIKPPQWYHCELVVNEQGRRLAKRHDSLNLRTLRERGLTPMEVISSELPFDE
jgi:glutamyl/glutaminyl-tRNA synthetase